MADPVKTDALLDELLKDCLGYERHEKEAEGRENTRNGRSAKRLQGVGLRTGRLR